MPSGSLLLSGSTLYGTAAQGGNVTGGNGTVFRVETDGNNFSVLHSFAGNPNDGFQPYAALIQSGSMLYGTTFYGANESGTVFRVAPDGGSYGLLHVFGGGGDGRSPDCTLLQSGSILYGTTVGGGTAANSGGGTIFKIGIDGSGYSVLHSFAGFPNDGNLPYGSLIEAGSTLYGMTSWGGSYGSGYGSGTIFKIGTDGTGFAVLHSFGGSAGDGSDPLGSLLLSGTTLYGMTLIGGSAGDGTIFQISTDGTGYGVLHSFLGGPNDGSRPFGDLTLSGSTLYGMTYYGGSGNLGTIFNFPVPVPEPSSLLMTAVAAPLALLTRRRRSNRGDGQGIAD